MKNVIKFLALSCAMAVFSAGADPTPLTLDGSANSSLIDSVAGDGKGGWVDLGSNDMHVLPSGKQLFAGVQFVIPKAKSENDKHCIVLGLNRDDDDDVELKVPSSGTKGRNLYLLHACSGSYKNRDLIGVLKLKYEDGSKEKKSIRFGRDIADWMHPYGGSNAVRAWSEYNHNTQVSLFVSQFAVDPKKRLAEIEFDGEKRSVWMIVAATLDTPRDKLRGLTSDMRLVAKYQTPPAPEKPFASYPAGAKPKNVILLIGDGMGQGAVKMQSLHLYGKPENSYFSYFPVSTLCTTYSASSSVTDSAAAGTALATGVKTYNGVLGLQAVASGKHTEFKMLTSIAEKAHAKGMKIALVTQDGLTGATPGAFYAHVRGRGEAAKIARQASECGYEVLLGHRGSMKHFLPNTVNGGAQEAGVKLLDEMSKKDYVVVNSQKEFADAPKNKKVIGFWNVFEGEQALSEMVKTSIDRIGDAEKGFFMMAECYLTDSGGHGNRPETSTLGVTQVEWMAKVAMDYASKRSDTLVIVTSDHETGAISVSRSSSSGKLHIFYGDTSHTKAPVPLYAFGPGADRLDVMLDNTDLARIIGELLDLQ